MGSLQPLTEDITMGWRKRHLLGITEFTVDEMAYIMRKSREVEIALQRHDQRGYQFITDPDVVVGKAMFEDSTRTRISFEAAARLCGAVVEGFDSAKGTSYSNKGESTAHTMIMLNEYRAVVAFVRHHLDGAPRHIAQVMQQRQMCGAPFTGIINAGDGKHEHPTQTILDRYTILKALNRLSPDSDHQYSLRGLTILLANDLKYGRVPHSNVKDFARDKVHFIFVAPPQMQMPEMYLRYIEECGSTYEMHDRLDDEVLHRPDVVCMFRSQFERMPPEIQAELRATRNDFIMTPEKVKAMKREAILLHPLPIPRWDPEIHPLVDNLSQAMYFEQAGNGIPTRIVEIALTAGYLGEDFEGQTFVEETEEDIFFTQRPHVAREHDGLHSIRPIQDGVVIDHLPPGEEITLLMMLHHRKGDEHRIATVEKKNHPGQYKGMLMLPGRELTIDELRLVGARVGGRLTHGEPVTVNTIRGGQVVQKLDLQMPRAVVGLGSCNNIIRDAQGNVMGGCIAHPYFNEHATPHFVRVAENLYRCWYCDQLHQASEIFS